MSERAKIRIRGIYSTALTNIFLKRGFAIVFPSALVRQRFGLMPVPDTIGINGENIIIRFGVNIGENVQVIPEKRPKTGGIDVGTKGRKNVKKPKKQVLEKKAEKAEQKKR